MTFTGDNKELAVYSVLATDNRSSRQPPGYSLAPHNEHAPGTGISQTFCSSIIFPYMSFQLIVEVFGLLPLPGGGFKQSGLMDNSSLVCNFPTG